MLDYPLATVWSLIRDFNNYPAYIDGVTESVIEDDKGGDEVGAIRRFCYLGNWIRQRLARHSDAQHTLTYAGIEPFPFPTDFCRKCYQPTRYEGTIPAPDRSSKGPDLHSEWDVALDTAPHDADRWRRLFESGYRLDPFAGSGVGPPCCVRV